MKPIDADALKKKNPDRRSLNTTLDKAPELSIADIVEDVKKDICDNYCKMPYKYSEAQWDEIFGTEACPCWNCPLNRL